MIQERLEAYRDLKLEHDSLAAKIEELEAKLYDPRAQRLDGMPRNGSGGDKVRTEALIQQKDKTLKLYKAKEAKLSADLVAIEAAIEVLEPRERTLIRLHYLQGLTWEAVAEATNYSERQVYRIRDTALEALRNQEKKETEQCG